VGLTEWNKDTAHLSHDETCLRGRITIVLLHLTFVMSIGVNNELGVLDTPKNGETNIFQSGCDKPPMAMPRAMPDKDKPVICKLNP